MSHSGEFAALTVAVVWTATALLFEVVTKRIGVLAVNILKLFMAFFMLAIICKIMRGSYFPFDASPYQWYYLSISGIVGFVFGDWCLLKAFEKSGSRISMLIMASNPAIALILGFLFLSETIDIKAILAMIVTFLGIVIAVLARNKSGRNPVTLSGILYGLGGALGQAAGLVLSKKGMGNFDAFAATEIRVLAGLFGFIVLMLIQNRTLQILETMKDGKTMTLLAFASFLGPSLGVGLSLYAIQNTNASIAASIMSIVPILIIVPSIVFLKQKTSLGEVFGAIISVVGVMLFFV